MKTLIVTGCTRSGLTLMMQLLNRGGYPCLGTYPAFEDYELGRIDWSIANGKAIKLVDGHLQFPPKGDYHVIMMRRDLDEQAKSVIKFMKFIGIQIDKSKRNIIKVGLKRDLKIIHEWAIRQTGFIEIQFEHQLSNPTGVLKRITDMTGFVFDKDACNVVVKRDSNCYNGMLELSMLK